MWPKLLHLLHLLLPSLQLPLPSVMWQLGARRHSPCRSLPVTRCVVVVLLLLQLLLQIMLLMLLLLLLLLLFFKCMQVPLSGVLWLHQQQHLQQQQQQQRQGRCNHHHDL